MVAHMLIFVASFKNVDFKISWKATHSLTGATKPLETFERLCLKERCCFKYKIKSVIEEFYLISTLVCRTATQDLFVLAKDSKYSELECDVCKFECGLLIIVSYNLILFT